MKIEKNRRTHPNTLSALLREMQAAANCSKAISNVEDKCIKTKARSKPRTMPYWDSYCMPLRIPKLARARVYSPLEDWTIHRNICKSVE